MLLLAQEQMTEERTRELTTVTTNLQEAERKSKMLQDEVYSSRSRLSEVLDELNKEREAHEKSLLKLNEMKGDAEMYSKRFDQADLERQKLARS